MFPFSKVKMRLGSVPRVGRQPGRGARASDTPFYLPLDSNMIIDSCNTRYHKNLVSFDRFKLYFTYFVFVWLLNFLMDMNFMISCFYK